MGHTLTIPSPDGAFGAYLARAAGASAAPTVVVVQEIFGINADMRETCDELAAQGFNALCQDLFWRLEPGVELSSFNEAEWRKGLSLYEAFDFDQGPRDVALAMDWARRLPGSNGQVGVMGFCLGGLMSFLTAARHGADAAVAYYGGGTERYLDDADTLTSPLLMHLAEEDEFIDKAAQRAIKARLADVPAATVYSYAGCNHAFARHHGHHYDRQAADLANGRTADFLKRHLG